MLVYCKKDIYHYFEDYLRALNIKVIFENPEKCNIYIQSIPNNIIPNKDTWLINTEQATRPNILDIIGNAINIYDYSEENIEILRKLIPNGNFKLLRYPIHHSDIYNIPKTKWFCMIGNNCERRYKIQNLLWNVTNIIGWNKERDIELFKHRILINVHYDPRYSITEQIRINRCIYNKMIVISEESIYQDLIYLKDKIIFCKYDDIPQVAIDTMKNYKDIYYKFYGDT